MYSCANVATENRVQLSSKIVQIPVAVQDAREGFVEGPLGGARGPSPKYCFLPARVTGQVTGR